MALPPPGEFLGQQVGQRVPVQRAPGGSRCAERGFTFMELMVGLTVALIGLAGLLGFYGTMVRSSRNAESAKEANSIATETLEDLRGMSFEDIILKYHPSPPGSTPFPVEDYLPFEVDMNAMTGTANQVYRRVLQVSMPIADYVELIKTRITVVWMERGAEDIAGNEDLRHQLMMELLRTHREAF